jgi:hypothetical protein
MLSKIIGYENFAKFNKNFEWINKVRKFYESLSNFVHVRGQQMSSAKLGGLFQGEICDIKMPSFSLESLGKFLEDYIFLVREIGVFLVLYNPVLLIGLPLEEKHGLDGPMSGYFEQEQSDNLKLLLPSEYHEFFNNLRDTDLGIQNIKEFYEQLPDITEDELTGQIKLQEKFFAKPNNDS